MENIDKKILENIDIDKEIFENIDIDKISNRLEFGISNRARSRPKMGLMYSVILIVKIKVKPWQPCTKPIFFVAFHSFYLELFQAFVEIRSFVAIVIEEGCNHI